VRLRLGGLDRTGRALDCRGTDLDPAQVVRAVRDPADDRVRCPRPGAIHEHVGLVRAGESLARRRLLATVALSRGRRPAVLDELAAARRRLDEHALDAPDRRTARERVATTEGDRERLRERVARLRGTVQARREAGLDADEARERLREAAKELSEVSTERAAATQRLADARDRDRVDERRHRLRLEDRVANLERDARATLAEAVEARVATALARLTDATLAEAPPPLVRLAAARVGVVAAPVVITAGPFDASRAAEWLGAQVVRL
jgi:hypothetical protein